MIGNYNSITINKSIDYFNPSTYVGVIKSFKSRKLSKRTNSATLGPLIRKLLELHKPVIMNESVARKIPSPHRRHGSLEMGRGGIYISPVVPSSCSRIFVGRYRRTIPFIVRISTTLGGSLSLPTNAGRPEERRVR
jgi:hypothetical protein